MIAIRNKLTDYAIMEDDCCLENDLLLLSPTQYRALDLLTLVALEHPESIDFALDYAIDDVAYMIRELFDTLCQDLA